MPAALYPPLFVPEFEVPTLFGLAGALTRAAERGPTQVVVNFLFPLPSSAAVVAAGRAGNAPCRVEGPWTPVPGLSVRGSLID